MRVARVLAVWLWAGLAMLSSAGTSPAWAETPPEPPTEANYCLAQARQNPEWRVEEVYKWLFQATQGGEHSGTSVAVARAVLRAEVSGLAMVPGDGEPLWTPLTADGKTGRLHLRPYLAAGGNVDALAEAFSAGAARFEAHPDRFRAEWAKVGRLLEAQPLNQLTAEAFQKLDGTARAAGYPAIHHSAEWKATAHPAYRVMPRAEAEALLRAEGLSLPEEVRRPSK